MQRSTTLNDLALKHKLQKLKKMKEQLCAPRLFALSVDEQQQLNNALAKINSQIHSIESRLYSGLAEFTARETAQLPEQLSSSLWFFPFFEQYLTLLNDLLANLDPSEDKNKRMQSFAPELLSQLKKRLIQRSTPLIKA